MDLDQTYPWLYRKIIPESTDYLLNNENHSFSTPGKFFTNWYQLRRYNRSRRAPPDMQRVTFTSAYLDVDGNGYPDRIIGHGGGHLSFIFKMNSFILYDNALF